MRYYTTLILALLIVALGCSSPKKQIQADSHHGAAANKAGQLKKILSKVPAGAESEYGFDSRSEMDSASLGEEFTAMRWNGAGLDTSREHQYPLLANGEFRAFVTFAESADSLLAVDFGATGLAREVQSVLKKFPEAQFGGLVRVYEIKGDFLCLIIKNVDYYAPLESVRRKMPPKGIQSIDLMTREMLYDYLKGLK